MNDIKPMTDYASQQSDRWLFIATLIILLMFSLVIWRWLIADREKLAKRLAEITDKHIASSERLAEVVTNNTMVMNEVRAVMGNCRTIQQR